MGNVQYGIVASYVFYVYFILIIFTGVMVGRHVDRLLSFAVMIGMVHVGLKLLFWVEEGHFMPGMFGGFFGSLLFPLVFLLVVLLSKKRQSPQMEG